VLIYHRVLPEPDPLLPGLMDARQFEEQVATLTQSFNLLPLPRAIEALTLGKLPARAASITFDDGYADNESIALPILRRHGVHATFFIAAGYLDGGCMWNDAIIQAVRRTTSATIDAEDIELGMVPLDTEAARRRAILRLVSRLKYCPHAFRDMWTRRLLDRVRVKPPSDLMMRSDQVRALHDAGMEIGGHTVRHPILTKVGIGTAEREIVEGKDMLEAITGDRVGLFAYPNGRPGIDFGPQHVRQVKDAGFDAALATRWGAAHTDDDLFQLPRFSSWDRSEWRFQARMVLNILHSQLDLPSPRQWELSN
jgi:peptidoglycan/xylan/chitin deacetylase (PgdA/CDA1 family)